MRGFPGAGRVGAMGYGFSRAAVTVCEGISGCERKQWRSSARCMGERIARFQIRWIRASRSARVFSTVAMGGGVVKNIRLVFVGRRQVGWRGTGRLWGDADMD